MHKVPAIDGSQKVNQTAEYSITDVFGAGGERQQMVTMSDLTTALRSSVQRFEKHSQALVQK